VEAVPADVLAAAAAPDTSKTTWLGGREQQLHQISERMVVF
jgi:hypothetical protein